MILLAHQGTGSERLGNTMDAFAWAVDQGATWIETDVHSTADGHLVCIHDSTLDRTTRGNGAVRDHLLSEMKELGVPALADAVREFPSVSWNIDLKQHRPSIAPLMARCLDALALGARVRVASFSGRVIREFRRITGGRVRTAAALDEVARAWGASRLRLPLRRPSYDALQVPLRRGVTVTDERMVATAHAASVEIHVWTIDDAAEAERLARLGVDGIITNRFDLLRSVF